MISYSAVQDVASDLEFAATIISPAPDIEEHESWWLNGKDGGLARERVRVGKSLELAAQILNALTIGQVESLPTYLNR